MELYNTQVVSGSVYVRMYNKGALRVVKIRGGGGEQWTSEIYLAERYEREQRVAKVSACP